MVLVRKNTEPKVLDCKPAVNVIFFSIKIFNDLIGRSTDSNTLLHNHKVNREILE